MAAKVRWLGGFKAVLGAALLAGLLLPQPIALADEERPVIVVPRASGRDLFNTCIPCHRWDGRGGKSEGGNAANLRRTRLTLQEIVGIITDGRQEKGMPSFKGFLDDYKINTLAKFIKEELKDPEN
jgi:mono/diheme cytochrome c family protein